MKSEKAKTAAVSQSFTGPILLSRSTHCQPLSEISDITRQDLLSEFMPVIEKTYFTFTDLATTFPTLKNEPLFAEVKELFKKYEDENY